MLTRRHAYRSLSCWVNGLTWHAPYEERGRGQQAREECSGDSHPHPPHRKRRLTLYLLFVLLRQSIWPWPQLLDLCLILLWGVDYETTHHPGVAKAITFPPYVEIFSGSYLSIAFSFLFRRIFPQA